VAGYERGTQRALNMDIAESGTQAPACGRSLFMMMHDRNDSIVMESSKVIMGISGVIRAA